MKVTLQVELGTACTLADFASLLSLVRAHRAVQSCTAESPRASLAKARHHRAAPLPRTLWTASPAQRGGAR